MAVYPSGLPTSGDIPDAGADLAANPHSSLHDDMRDEIVAICAELGVGPSGSAATVRARLDDLSKGWNHISSSTFSGSGTSSFTVLSVPAGFASLRLRMVGRLIDGEDRIGIRVNADSTANLHVWGGNSRDSVSATGDQFFAGESTMWHVGLWAAGVNNTVDVHIDLNVPFGTRASFRSESTRNSGTASANKRSFFHGNLAADRTVTSLVVLRATTAASTGFDPTRLTLEGYVI
jgi:hypothetical protein